MSFELAASIRQHEQAFGLSLTDEQIDRLSVFYDLVLEHNPILHLVAPCSAEEFAVRHILESLTLLQHLPQNAKFADVGTGAGLPSIPCLLVRDDLKALLIESKEKKAVFLNEAVGGLKLSDRVTISNRQYAEVDPGDCEFVTCRAMEKFTERLPHLVRWSKRRTLLLFGGESLADGLRKLKLPHTSQLMPMSERRYLYRVGR